MSSLPSELVEQQKVIQKLAKARGLDFYDTVFEMVNYKQMNQIAAYGGFPVRYPHWRFGMEYEKLSKGYEYGLSKIYELVINNDPCYAYLLEGNSLLDQKLVMAHVYGHCDFFKNNFWFSKTDRKMMDNTANNSTRIRRYVERFGYDTVENFIDACLSLENLIDRHSPYQGKIKSKEPNSEPPPENTIKPSYKIKPYLASYIKAMGLKHKLDPDLESAEPLKPDLPPEKDVLLFLLQNAPLEDWQQDVLSIIRSESYYFAPQGMTKIMNEGWASYWHSRMMTEEICTSSEIIQFADVHSGTMAMSPMGFNPYKVGIELFRNVEQRWDRGQHGREWESCTDEAAKKAWNTNAKKGQEKIFEVRKHMNDVIFIDEFLTEDFCVKNKMFVYKYDQNTNQFVVDAKNFKAIKASFLFQLTNFGQPTISVVDSNFENRGELLLSHTYEGVDLQPDYMQETLSHIYKIWSRPVNLATVLDGTPNLVRYNGEKFGFIQIGEQEKAEEK